jgi:aminoglycoside phosphotransferase (APT) family kinase protein
VPHGFADDARSRLLRARPTSRSIDWVERALGVTVRRVVARRGGRSSAVHILHTTDGHPFVLRSYVAPEVTAEEPSIVAREAHVLKLLVRSEISTPDVLAVDATGADAGVPSLLMSRLPGRLDWAPRDLDAWLHRLASVLPVLHAAPITADDDVQPFLPYQPASWEPPAWLRDRALWTRALTVFHGPRLDHDEVFVHRDYHPGNVLWRGGRVTGVVDWQAASIGPRAADVWHCRGNLLGHFDLSVADHFLQIWQDVSGTEYHPWAEAVMLVDAISWLGPRRAQVRRDLEDLLARRLAELGA